MDKSTIERFMKFVYPVTESGCWLWTGASRTRGYGTFHLNRKNRPAHRISHEIFKGPIPEGFDIDHLCKVTCCVNPDHIEAVTVHENVKRGRGCIARFINATHCKYGHLLDESNVFMKKTAVGVTRVCIACAPRRKELSKKNYRKRMEKYKVLLKEQP